MANRKDRKIIILPTINCTKLFTNRRRLQPDDFLNFGSIRVIDSSVLLHSIMNYRSIRVVEKLGFTNEGRSEKYLKIDGKWEDHIHMVLINEMLEKSDSGEE